MTTTRFDPARVAVAQLGARMHYAVPRLLHAAGRLERLFTDSYAGDKPRLARALAALPRPLRPRALARWLGRNEPALPGGKVTSFELLGLACAARKAGARNDAARFRLWAEEAARFNAAVLAHGLGAAGTVWGYSSAALELFVAAAAEGRRCVLEQVILPSRLQARLLAAEAARWPGWQEVESTIAGLLRHAEREAEEWRLATRIVAGSAFVVEGLASLGVDPGKCRIVPYGVDSGRFRRRPVPRPRRPGEPLRVLFAGEVGLRKGAPYLLEALRRLGPGRVQGRFAGTVALKPERLAPYHEVAAFLGPVPRPGMIALYDWADVFVLPSLFEGSATVTYEALACGVPVVCTPATGSIVRAGVDGAIVPAGSLEALAAVLAALADGDLAFPAPGRDHPLGDLDAYGRGLLAVLDELVPGAAP
jgi:glycosyltransferase involved in cell wall biosynthesis